MTDRCQVQLLCCSVVQVSHSSEEVLALKKDIARCQAEADKLRTAIALNKVSCNRACCIPTICWVT